MDEQGAAFQRVSDDLGRADEDFRRFGGDLGGVDDHAERVRQEMEYLNGAVEQLHQPFSSLRQDIQDLDAEFPNAVSEADRVRAAMADLHDEEERLAGETGSLQGTVSKLSGNLNEQTAWWGRLAGQQRSTGDEAEKLRAAMGDVDKAARDTADGVAEADAEMRRVGPDMDKAMASARRLTQRLFLLKSASKSTSSGFMGMSPMIAGITAAVAGLSGALGGVLALGIPAFFVLLGGGAAMVKSSLDKLTASGQKLTAMQKLELSVVTPIADAFAKLKPILDQTATAFAGVMRSLGPEFQQAFSAMGPMIKDAGAGLGNFISILVKGFAPMMKSVEPVMKAFWQGLGDVANGLVGMMKALDFKQGAQGLTDLLKAVGQLLVLAGQLITALAPLGHFLLGQLLPVVIKLAGAITAGLGDALKNAGPAFSQFAKAFGKLVDLIDQVMQPLGKLVAALLPGFMGALSKGVGILTAFLKPVVDAVVAISNWISASKAWSTAIGVIIGAWVALRLVMMTNPFILIITAILFVAGLIIDHWTAIKNFLIGVWHGIEDVAKAVWNAIKDFFIGLIAGIVERFIQQWVGLEQFFTGLWAGITGTIKAVWNAIKNFFVGLISGIVERAIQQWDGLKHFFSNLWTGITSQLYAQWEVVKAFFANLWHAITGIVSNAGQWLVNVGSNIIHGLWQGIQNAWSWLMGKIQGIGSDIVGAFKSVLKVFSPSKVMADEVGRFIPEGIAQGILNYAGVVSNAARKVTQGAVTGAQVGLSMVGSLNPGNALGASAGGGNVYLTFSNNQVMNSQSIQELADKAGQQVARYSLPAAGRFIHG